jgi:uncharacterized protein YlxW (UPF0749 family)
MNFMRVFKRGHGVVILTIVFIFISVHIVQAVTATPAPTASANELIVASQDYVDAKISELNTKINSLTSKVNELTTANAALKEQIGSLQSQDKGFEVLELEAGKQLIAGSGAEIILRSGKAQGISGQYGGLSDVTSGSGVDIKTGTPIPLNHLLIVSREDGRGLKTETKSFLIIRGGYTIK